MTTEQIVGNLIFMPGRREVRLWATGTTYTLTDLSVGDVFGDHYSSLIDIVTGLDLLLCLNMNTYLSIVHKPTKRSVPVAYLFLGGDNEWLPLDHDTTENQMRGIVKRFRAETMSPSDFG
jgi:hypothetical protein